MQRSLGDESNLVKGAIDVQPHKLGKGFKVRGEFGEATPQLFQLSGQPFIGEARFRAYPVRARRHIVTRLAVYKRWRGRHDDTVDDSLHFSRR
jgi:hypothetical protein